MSNTDTDLRMIGTVDRRMESLMQAIKDRDWDQTEFEYDRVLGALNKYRRMLRLRKDRES